MGIELGTSQSWGLCAASMLWCLCFSHNFITFPFFSFASGIRSSILEFSRNFTNSISTRSVQATKLRFYLSIFLAYCFNNRKFGSGSKRRISHFGDCQIFRASYYYEIACKILCIYYLTLPNLRGPTSLTSGGPPSQTSGKP